MPRRTLAIPLLHRHSRGDSRPLPGPRIFPAGYVGSREESGHELPAGMRAPKRELDTTLRLLDPENRGWDLDLKCEGQVGPGRP